MMINNNNTHAHFLGKTNTNSFRISDLNSEPTGLQRPVCNTLSNKNTNAHHLSSFIIQRAGSNEPVLYLIQMKGGIL